MGRRSIAASAAALSLLLVAGPAAQAADDPAEADFRCFAAMSQAGGGDTVADDTRAQLASGALYFLGKLDGRDPDLDLENALAERAKTKMKPKQLRREMARCSAELKSRAQVLQEIGDSLRARAQDDGDADPAPPN
jgi:hypothetical protein